MSPHPGTYSRFSMRAWWSAICGPNLRPPPRPALTHGIRLPRRTYLSSCGAGETVSDDGSFRKAFLRALAGELGANANDDGYLTASELSTFFVEQGAGLGLGTTPSYGDRGTDRGDFLFAHAIPLAQPEPPTESASPSPEKETCARIRDSTDRTDYAAFALDTGHRGMDCAVGGPIGPAFGGARLDLTTNSWSDPSFAQTSRHPVVCVSWDDAKAYLSWLSRAAGKIYRSQAKPSGSTRHAREPRHYGFGGSAPPRRAISRTRRTKDRTGTTSTRTHSVPRHPTAAMTVTPTQGQWAGTQPTRSACTTCWGTFRSGSRTVQANRTMARPMMARRGWPATASFASYVAEIGCRGRIRSDRRIATRSRPTVARTILGFASRGRWTPDPPPGQNASALSAITGSAPEVILDRSEEVSGSTRAMKKWAVASLAS